MLFFSLQLQSRVDAKDSELRDVHSELQRVRIKLILIPYNIRYMYFGVRVYLFHTRQTSKFSYFKLFSCVRTSANWNQSWMKAKVSLENAPVSLSLKFKPKFRFDLSFKLCWRIVLCIRCIPNSLYWNLFLPEASEYTSMDGLKYCTYIWVMFNLIVNIL